MSMGLLSWCWFLGIGAFTAPFIYIGWQLGRLDERITEIERFFTRWYEENGTEDDDAA